MLVSCQKDDEGVEVCLRNVCLFAPWQGAVKRRRFHPLQSPSKLQHMHNVIVIIQGYTNAERRVAQATKFCAAARYICASSASNSFRIDQLSPRNLRWHLGFWKKCVPLIIVIVVSPSILQVIYCCEIPYDVNAFSQLPFCCYALQLREIRKYERGGGTLLRNSYTTKFEVILNLHHR